MQFDGYSRHTKDIDRRIISAPCRVRLETPMKKYA